MSRALWKTKPPQRECTTACGHNLQIERALHRTVQSSNRGEKADTTVSSNPSGIHRPANTRRRARYEQHGRAQPHQTLQHRTTQNINDKQRADTAVCRNSSTRRRVHAIRRGTAGAAVPVNAANITQRVDTAIFSITTQVHNGVWTQSADRAGTDAAESYHSKPQNKRAGTAVSINSTQVHNGMCTQLAEIARA